MKEELAAQGS